MKILDNEIKLNMLVKSEILGSDMETRAQNWALEDSYHSESIEKDALSLNRHLNGYEYLKI